MTIWKGCLFDARTADMLTAVDRVELPDTSFVPSQGSYTTSVGASGGTHAGGGAVDIALAGLDDTVARRIETGMRRVGFAAWYRTAIPNVWPRHVHGIAVGCSDLSSQAAAQVTAYKNGRDGLAGNGADTGNRSYVNVTWEAYHQQHPYVLEDIMASRAEVRADLHDELVSILRSGEFGLSKDKIVGGVHDDTVGIYRAPEFALGQRLGRLEDAVARIEKTLATPRLLAASEAASKDAPLTAADDISPH